MDVPEPKLFELFSRAAECPTAQEQAAYLDQACQDDAELRARLENLLQAHRQAGSFLQEPSGAMPPSPVGGEWLAVRGGATIDVPAPAERPGTTIGPYKLLQQIGEGGMGVVWMAEQTQPVQRKVALKVIKPGMDSRQVIARFEAERQALAMMDHVNIARVFDGGTTPPSPPSQGGAWGAINNATGTLTVSRSVFRDNRAIGGLENGVPGGFGAGIGGAISNVARFGNAILAVSHSTFLDNRAVGGAIANYIFGGVASPVTVSATATVAHSIILGNQAIGGAGPTGGTGQGGGIANENGGGLTVSNSLIALNRAIGGAGDGGNGGSGLGGGIFNGPSQVATPSLTLQRTLIVRNRADGGASVGGSAGLGQGGGLYLAPGGLASADFWTLIFANVASTSDDDVFGILA